MTLVLKLDGSYQVYASRIYISLSYTMSLEVAGSPSSHWE